MNELKDYSDTQLLKELIKRGNVQEAPTVTRRGIPHSSVLVGIGADHYADIVIANDSLVELEKLK